MNRTLTLTALVSLTALASGCETVDAARDFFAERERKSEEEKLVRARQACEKFGFSKGTDAFAGCVQTEINQAKLRAAAAAAAAAPAPRSQSTTPELTPMFPPAPAPTTTTCRRTILGTLECTSR